MSRIQSPFQNVEVYYFMQLTYTNFLKYYEISFTDGGDMLRRILKTFQKVEEYILRSRHILIFEDISKNPIHLEASW